MVPIGTSCRKISTVKERGLPVVFLVSKWCAKIFPEGIDNVVGAGIYLVHNIKIWRKVLMTKYGYISLTALEEVDNLTEQLGEVGCDLVITDIRTTRTAEKVELDQLLEQLSPHDILVVNNLSRLARGTEELLTIFSRVVNAGASVQSLEEPWVEEVFTYPPVLNRLFTGLHAFEKNILSERVKEGMEIAKSKGVSVGRPTANINKLEHALNLYNTAQYTAKEITEICGISKSTLYRELRKRGLVRK